MTDALELMALQNIYGKARTNPHENRLKAVSGMMPESGLAKPLLALVAGKELAAAGEWDDQREASALEGQNSAMQMLKEKRDMEQKQKNVDAYVKIAQVDPIAANAINEKLGLFPGINLTGKLTKEGFVDIDFAKDNAQGIPEGHFKVNVNDLMAAGREQDPAKKQEIIGTRFFKINAPADKHHPTPDQRSFEAFTNKYYLDNGIDPAKATPEQKNAAELFAQKQMEGSKVKVAGAGRSTNVSLVPVVGPDGKLQYKDKRDAAGMEAPEDPDRAAERQADRGGVPPTPPLHLLKDGYETEFRNGQVWTLKNGRAVRVK